MITSEALLPPLGQCPSLIMPLLYIAHSRSVVHIGSADKKLIKLLLSYLESVDGKLNWIDFFSSGIQAKKIIASTSHVHVIPDRAEIALPDMEAADMYIIDDDYNYYSVFKSLCSAWGLNGQVGKPFLAVVRGVGWPFARRDAYRNPDIIPEEYRKPYSWSEGILVEYSEIRPDGLRVDNMAFARHEGGEQNGVQTAVWDFTAQKTGLKCISIPALGGLSVIFSTQAPYADKIAAFLNNDQLRNNLVIQFEEHRLDLCIEFCNFQYEAAQEALALQNHYFYTAEFMKRMQQSEGKKAGLGIVSIIIPAFNDPKLISESIQSALQQTYQDIEVIVVNNTGKDLQPFISSLQDGRIVCLTHAGNGLVPSAYNEGIKKAKGKFIAYLNERNRFYPRHLEFLVNAMHESGFKAAFTDTFCVLRKNVCDNPKTRCKTLIPSDRVAQLQSLCVCHEKSCLETVGLFDETPKDNEDREMWTRLAKQFPLFHIPQAQSEFPMPNRCTSIQEDICGIG